MHLLAALLLLPASCAREEVPSAPGAARRLAFSVSDGGYAPPSGAATRAVENGYTTTFTEGDACGLYVVRGTETVYANVKLTAAADDATGSLVWQPDAGTVLAGGLAGEQYFLYYPYRADMTGKTAAPTGATMTDADFFKPLIDDWQPETDQSDYAAYTASDLMTAAGAATAGADNTLLLSFPMTHRMALAVIEMPRTVYKFTDDRIPDYTAFFPVTYTSSARPLDTGGGTYRHLVNPASATVPTIEGSYDGGSREFAVTPSGVAAGSYRTYRVDGGGTRTVEEYTVSVGDYLLADGRLLPKGTALTAAQKASVAAVVFWTPAETDPTDPNRKTPASLADDRVMSAEHPSCTHGLAVAVKNVSDGMAWQSLSESIKDFQSGDNFTPPGKAGKDLYVSVASNFGSTDSINFVLGYQNTQVLLAYNAWCKATSGKENCIVRPAAALAAFSASHPAPAGSTGWFVPSVKELHMLCHADADDVWEQWGAGMTGTKDLVNASLSSAGGDALGGWWYWSSTENEGNSGFAFGVNFSGVNVDYYFKGDTDRVRAVCAF